MSIRMKAVLGGTGVSLLMWAGLAMILTSCGRSQPPFEYGHIALQQQDIR